MDVTYHEIWISRLNFKFCQHPDAIRKFDRLIQHVSAIHTALGNCKDVVVS